MCAGDVSTRATASTISCGCWRSPALFRPRISWTDIAVRSANASPRCTSGWAAARSKASANRAHVVWSRVFVADGKLQCDPGSREVVELPPEETEERWRLTTPQWPIMHAVLEGVTRDQMMARHKSNHIQVVYAPDGAGSAQGDVRQGRRHERTRTQGELLRRLR